MNETEKEIVAVILKDIKSARLGDRGIAIAELNAFLDTIRKRISNEQTFEFRVGNQSQNSCEKLSQP